MSLLPVEPDGSLNAAGGFRAFVFVRSRGDEEATVRLQSAPLAGALAALPGVRVETIAPEAAGGVVLREPTCVVFHYYDAPAIRAVRAMRREGHRALVVCLGCDLYDFGEYAALHDLVDVFTMPTEPHRGLLAGQIYKPVRLLPEGVDPVAFAGSGPPRSFPGRSRRRALWFGYAESFDKGMTPLIPVIQAAVASGALEGFTAMLNLGGFDNRHGLQTLAYDHRRFGEQAQAFDYAILSHLPADLMVNSLIKSPNKAVTAVLAGLIPIASDTPSYRALFERHGLTRFLFASPAELQRKLRHLDPVADSAALQASGVIDALLEEGSPERLRAHFLAALEPSEDEALDLPLPPPLSSAYAPPTPRAHLADFLPSVRRALDKRFRPDR